MHKREKDRVSKSSVRFGMRLKEKEPRPERYDSGFGEKRRNKVRRTNSKCSDVTGEICSQYVYCSFQTRARFARSDKRAGAALTKNNDGSSAPHVERQSGAPL